MARKFEPKLPLTGIKISPRWPHLRFLLPLVMLINSVLTVGYGCAKKAEPKPYFQIAQDMEISVELFPIKIIPQKGKF